MYLQHLHLLEFAFYIIIIIIHYALGEGQGKRRECVLLVSPWGRKVVKESLIKYFI